MWFQAKDISYSIDSNQIIKGLSLSIEPGKMYTILGTNGTGKSTLLQMFAGFLEPDTGTIHLDSERVWGPAYRLVPGHPSISLVKQDSRLHPLHTVKENLSYVLRAYDEDYQEEKIQELSSLLDLSRNWDKQVKYLSGGEQQRVAIAAALAKNPLLLLLDEPFSQTDMLVKHELRGHLKQIVESLGISILFVSHEAQEALSLADYLFVLYEGKILEEGEPHEVYFRPRTEQTAELTGICNWLPKSLFPHLTYLHSVGEYWLLRPDQIVSLEIGGVNSFDAYVVDVEFAGFYQLVTFHLPSTNIKVTGAFLSSFPIKKGLKTSISFIHPQ